VAVNFRKKAQIMTAKCDKEKMDPKQVWQTIFFPCWLNCDEFPQEKNNLSKESHYPYINNLCKMVWNSQPA